MGAIQQPFTFVGRQAFGLIDGNTATACPAFGRLAWLTFGVKRLGNGRTAFFDFAIGLCSAQIGHFQRQAARSGKPAHFAVFEVGAIELGGKIRGKSFCQ
ncbi:hypothetical protein D3C78_1376190 [compost metagenome]